ncbi:MAG: thioesterase [Clostridiales bacterium]|nr:thioesterase [Clostridiales bacterium]
MYHFESRVRYSEVDSEKKITLPSLLDYLQDCCTFQSEDLGVGVEHLAETKTAWVLSSWEIRINRYPEMGEHIRVCTWPYDFKSFYGYRNFTVEDEEGNVLADANSVWVFMDLTNMCPTRISEAMKEAYISDIEPGIEGEWAPRKINVPESENVEKKEPVGVARFFIDTNHHMNNGKYVVVAEEYLPEGFKVRRLRAEYKKAAVLGDVLYPIVVTEEHQVTVTLADENEVPYAVIQFLEEYK